MSDPKLVWTSTDTPPPGDMFHWEYDGGPLEARVLLAIEGCPEPQKGRCIKRFGGAITWQADGCLGPWKFTDWMPMPKVPHD